MREVSAREASGAARSTNKRRRDEASGRRVRGTLREAYFFAAGSAPLALTSFTRTSEAFLKSSG